MGRLSPPATQEMVSYCPWKKKQVMEWTLCGMRWPEGAEHLSPYCKALNSSTTQMSLEDDAELQTSIWIMQPARQSRETIQAGPRRLTWRDCETALQWPVRWQQETHTPSSMRNSTHVLSLLLMELFLQEPGISLSRKRLNCSPPHL